MRTILFLALGEPEPTARLFRAALRTGARIVLDLEDALWDVDDEDRTAALKASGRELLVALARDHAGLFERDGIGVRINRFGSRESDLDIEAIGRAGRFARVECVVVPKVENGGVLTGCADALERHGVSRPDLVPIVETRAAFARLGDLLRDARESGVRWVVYGHYDFALESGMWPIPGPFDPALWARADEVADAAESAGMGYIHPPCFDVYDDAELYAILQRLVATRRREFGILTVGLHQAAAAVRFRPGTAGPEPGPTGPAPVGDPVALACRTTAAYRETRRPGTSFALDTRHGEFISPHVYLAARRYLAENGHV